MFHGDRFSEDIGKFSLERSGFDDIAEAGPGEQFREKAVVKEAADLSGAQTIVFKFPAHAFIGDRGFRFAGLQVLQ